MSAAFPRIRNNTKIYNTHLVGTPSHHAAANYKLASSYTLGNSSIDAVDFGITRPSNMISSLSTLSSDSTSIDSSSLKRFMNVDKALLESMDSSEEFFVSGNDVLVSSSTGSRRSTDELYSRSASFVHPQSFLESPTLSDSTDKILPSEQSLAQQAFVNPQSKGPMFSAPQKSNLNSASTSLNSLSGVYTADG